MYPPCVPSFFWHLTKRKGNSFTGNSQLHLLPSLSPCPPSSHLGTSPALPRPLCTPPPKPSRCLSVLVRCVSQTWPCFDGAAFCQPPVTLSFPSCPSPPAAAPIALNIKSCGRVKESRNTMLGRGGGEGLSSLGSSEENLSLPDN